MKKVLMISLIFVLLGMFLFLVPYPSLAAPITVNYTFQFRLHHGPGNPINSPGDHVDFGADYVTPGRDQGTTGVAKQGTTIVLLNDYDSPNVNYFVNYIPYNAALTGPWALTFTNGLDTATAVTPDIVDAPLAPLVGDLSVSGYGLTPTFTWTIPSTFTPDGTAVFIYDMPTKQNIHAVILPALSNSYTVPAGVLQSGHAYALEVDIAQTRGHVTLTDFQNVEFFLYSYSDTWLFFSGGIPGEFAPADCDVDGSDLAVLIANTSLMDLATFAQNFGKNFCQ
jgi:hypothetical protein